MTRSELKAPALRALGAEAVVCDVYDAVAVREAVGSFASDAVVHQLTDLPDEESSIPRFARANARIRREGTGNLLAAARESAVTRVAAQSVAWPLPGDAGAAVRDLESAVLEFGGTVLRYGRFYGPGTFYESTPPSPPRVHIDAAAARTVAVVLGEETGVVSIVE
jgi:hypothetical protein